MEWTIKEESEFKSLAKEVSAALGLCHLLCLLGTMGSGKTTFVRYLVRELGGIDEVSSPTYAIVNEYKIGDKRYTGVYHMDLYRIEKIEELIALPLQDYLDSKHLCIIEWPQIAENMLSEPIQILKIEVLENSWRKVVLL